MKIYIKSEFYIGLVWIVSAFVGVKNLITDEGVKAYNIAVIVGSLCLMLAFIVDSCSRIPLFSLGSRISSDEIYKKSGYIIKKYSIQLISIAFYLGIALEVIGILGISKVESPAFYSFAMTGGPIVLMACLEFKYLINKFIPKEYGV